VASSVAGPLLNIVKTFVSQENIRFQQDGFDLDLTYITPRLLAMSLPAENFTATYRNSLVDVKKFFQKYHPGHFLILNLSGFSYDYSALDFRVLDFAFQDFFPPPLDLLKQIVLAMDSWLTSDSLNVCCVHCLAGRGRTAVAICSYLLFSNAARTPDEAVQMFTEKRSKNKLQTCPRMPSQLRYIRYFHSLKDPKQSIFLNSSTLFIDKIVMKPHPDLFTEAAISHTFIEIRSLASNELLKTAALTSSDSEQMEFSVQRCVSMDTLIRFVSPAEGLPNQPNYEMFRFVFHVSFVESKQMQLRKSEIDFQSRDHEFPEDFMVLVHFKEDSRGSRSLKSNNTSK